MNIQSILKDWLTSHGYDGLYSKDYECGCFLEDELCPCDEPFSTRCFAGYKVKLTGWYEGEWGIGPKKGAEP